jgi:hypothetical protein
MIVMIEGLAPVSAIRGVEAAVMTLSGAPSSQRGSARRDRRLKWLSSVREALGDAAPLVDEMANEDTDDRVFEVRARISDALNMVDQIRVQLDEDGEGGATGTGHGTITAAALARRIASAGDQSLRIQAKIGAAAVLRMIEETKQG